MTSRREYIIAFIWLLIVTPLILFSYGSDPDSGRLAEAALKIWEQQEYFRSRTGGHPLYEITLSPLVASGDWYFTNFLSLVLGFSILFALLYLARKNEFNYPTLVVVSIAFAPIFIKNATTTMDYMSALAFLTWSYVLMREKKYFYATILIGFAAGCRPITGLMIIPLMIYVWSNGKSLWEVAKIYFTTIVAALIVYSPFLFKYGIPGSSYMPDELKMIILRGGYYFLSFLGAIPSLIVFPALLFIAIAYRRKFSSFEFFHFGNIAVWFALFAYMPYEPEYLLPILLSVVLLFDKYLNYKVFVLITILIVSANFVKLELMGGKSGERSIALSVNEGYTIEEFRHRVFQNSLREVVTNFQVEEPTILYFGDYYVQVANDKWSFDEKLNLFKQKNGQLYIHEGDVSCKEHQSYQETGFTNVIWSDEKAGRATCNGEEKYYKVIDDLNAYFNTDLHGKLRTSK